ncbi:MAG: hypothetical protein HY429_02215 [Candidatus Levybacteria bacterium]|nr:hypothetical protein [Candidatus Levybacteria bacterium]
MRNNNNGGHLSTFLLGALFGAGIVFFLTTKKGKKILQTIKEEGLDGIEELSEMLEEEESFDAIQQEEGEDVASKEKTTNGEAHQNGSIVEHIKRVPRRFFKGVPKKS